jgi:hypothetical protein
MRPNKAQKLYIWINQPTHSHAARMDVPIGFQRTELAHLLEVSDVGGAEYEPR